MASGKAPEYKKEFAGSRTSWKFFDRHLNKDNDGLVIRAIESGSYEAWQLRILLEILKELQYLNDRK